MSWDREVCITCDECDDMQHGFGSGTTVTEARRHLREYGWKLTADGRDLCDTCVAERSTASRPMVTTS